MYVFIYFAILSWFLSIMQVEATLLEMFSVRCERTSAANPYFFRDYEMELQGAEWGRRVQDMEPFCGRTSLLNPGYLFYANEMKHDNGEPVEAYRVDYIEKVHEKLNRFKNRLNEMFSVLFPDFVWRVCGKF